MDYKIVGDSLLLLFLLETAVRLGIWGMEITREVQQLPWVSSYQFLSSDNGCLCMYIYIILTEEEIDTRICSLPPDNPCAVQSFGSVWKLGQPCCVSLNSGGGHMHQESFRVLLLFSSMTSVPAMQPLTTHLKIMIFLFWSFIPDKHNPASYASREKCIPQGITTRMWVATWIRCSLFSNAELLGGVVFFFFFR